MTLSLVGKSGLRAVLTSLVLTLACTGLNTGNQNNNEGDSGTPGNGDPFIPTVVTPTPVTGHAFYTWVTEGDAERVEDDDALERLELLIPTEDGVKTGTITKTGSGEFKTEALPAGPYFLKTFENTFIYTAQRSIDLDVFQLGRSDLETSAAPIELTLTLDKLSSWTENDTLELVSSNANASGEIWSETTIGNGSLKLTGTHWFGESESTEYEVRNPMVSGTKGDTAYVLQFGEEAQGSLNVRRVLRSLSTKKLDFSETKAAAIAGSMAIPPEKTLTFDWKRTQFAALRSNVHPQAEDAYEEFSLSPAATGLQKGWIGYSGMLAYFYVNDAAKDGPTSVKYGYPFTAPWDTVSSVTTYFQTPTLLPTSTSGGLYGMAMDASQSSQFAARAIKPRISPPQQFTVDGQSAYEERTLTSATPKLSWQAPELGTPNLYTVEISELFMDSESETPEETYVMQVAYIYSTERSLRIPPALLESGRSYAITVSAYLTPNVDSAHAPLRLSDTVDVAIANTVSGVLTVP